MEARHVSAPHPERTPGARRIGPYMLARRLGEGGMGVVYLAYAPSGQTVALKVMRPELARQADFRQRFEKEAEAARRVARFCTAPVLDAGVDGETAYLVTEYVDGPDLAAVIDAQGPMSGANLEALAVGVATALAAIHRAEVVHRDLKPSNILLSALGPRVIDFGVARLAESLHTGSVIGTPAYMAPEQARGEPVTAAADVFSWAGLIVYAGTGSPPFGTGSTPELLYRIVHHAPRLDGLDERLRPLVEQALDKDPARRPTAQRLLDRLFGRERVAAAAATRVVSDIWTPPAGAATPVAARALEAAEAGAAPAGEAATASPAGAPAETGAAAGPAGRGAARWWVPVAAAALALAVAAVTLVLVVQRTSGLPGGGERGPLLARDVKQDGLTLRLEIDGLRRGDAATTLTWTIKNISPEGSGKWYLSSRLGANAVDDTVSRVELIDPSTGTRYAPAFQDDRCVCSHANGSSVAPGGELPLYATYKDVPREAERLDVAIPGFGSFAGVPVTS